MDPVVTQFGNQSCKASVPDLRPGYQVKVHQKIREGNKERVQVFAGMVISVSPGQGVNSTFTVRKVSDGIGVERVYPIHSPNIVKIEVQRAHKVRRAKLNYLRDRSGKALRLKEVELNLKTKEFDVTPHQDASAGQAAEESAVEEVSAPVAETPVEAPKVEEKPEEKVEETAPAEEKAAEKPVKEEAAAEEAPKEEDKKEEKA